jgi:hypothetical protein
MRGCRLLAGLAIACLAIASGCQQPERLKTGTTNAATDRAVVQIETWGGMGGLWRLAPAITIWQSGRLVFVAEDSSVRIGSIPPDAVARLIQNATFLYDVDWRYSVCSCSDVPTTDFSLWTERGQRTVSVEGYSLQPTWTGEYGIETTDRLRQLHRAVLAVLPANASRFEPDEVVVRADPVESWGVVDVALRVRPWPESLLGHLTGERARDAVRLRPLVPPGPMEDIFSVDGETRRISVVPVLPKLNLPRVYWPPVIIPVHPAATAYNAPGEPFRFHGPASEQIASWYLKVMPTEGWRLVDRLPGEQVWVRAEYPHDPIVKLLFDSRHYRIGIVEAQNLVPRAPFAMSGGSGCSSRIGCWQADDVAPDHLEAWYREQLGYLGWREAGPNAYWRERPLSPYPAILPVDLARKEHESLRLAATTEGGRTTFGFESSPPVIPPGGWPAPEIEDERWPLCEATRGDEVRVAGVVYRLPESLCVTLREPNRLRVQVAYGSSFVELDPETGRPISQMRMWFDQPLDEHLAVFLPRPPGGPPPVGTPTPPLRPQPATPR